MKSLLEEIESESYRSLPPATLDETKAPDLTVLSRFTGQRMLHGKIERAAERWVWHFVLDTEATHEGCAGIASSYEVARSQLMEALRDFHVEVRIRAFLQLPT